MDLDGPFLQLVLTWPCATWGVLAIPKMVLEGHHETMWLRNHHLTVKQGGRAQNVSYIYIHVSRYFSM